MRFIHRLNGERLIGPCHEPELGGMMADKRDYYEVLGLEKNSSEAEVKSAFRSLARKHHPDKNPDDTDSERRFKEIQEAYAILSNPQERRKYDMFGHDRPGGSPFGSSGFQGVNISFDALFGGGFESIFSQFFGDSHSNSTKGSDLLVRHSVPFQAAFHGMDDELEIEVLKECNECGGTGSRNPEGSRLCPTCDGRGRIDEISMIGPFRQRVRKECSPCRGSGRIVSDPCNGCRGDGRSFQSIKVKFSIRPGISTGSRLRMRGQGEASTSMNGSPGDLYIEIDVETHPWFERDGTDLLMALPLSYADLLLGTRVELPHVDHEALNIKVPAGSIPGETITIHGRGLPNPRSSKRRGDVTVVLKLELPKKPSSSTTKSIRALREQMESELPNLENRVREEASKRRKS